MKYKYFVASIKENGKLYAYVIKTSKNDNILYKINVKNAPEIPFDCFDDAVNWIYKKTKKNNPDAVRKNVKKHLKNAILNNRQYHGYFWKNIKEG